MLVFTNCFAYCFYEEKQWNVDTIPLTDDPSGGSSDPGKNINDEFNDEEQGKEAGGEGEGEVIKIKTSFYRCVGAIMLNSMIEQNNAHSSLGPLSEVNIKMSVRIRVKEKARVRARRT